MASSLRSERRKKKFDNTKNTHQKVDAKKSNRNSILLLSTTVISLLVFVIFSTSNYKISSLFRANDNANFNTAQASIYLYETKSMIRQTKYGNSNQIVGYIVKYRYKVHDKLYDNEELLNVNTNATFLKQIISNLNQQSFYVRYEISNPEESYLIQDKINLQH